MRSRKHADEQVAEVARRRLALLSAELAGLRPDPVDTPAPGSGGGAHALPGDAPPAPPVAPGGPSGAGRHAHRPVDTSAALGGWLHDRLPATLQGRVGVGAGHLAVLALLVAGALGVTVWWVLRADGPTTLPPVSATPSPLMPPAPSTSVTATPAGDHSVGAAASPSGTIVVDVAGKVRRPGIATLPLGSRVVDALEAAGGARPGVRLGTLNLARVLTDGEQVVVGVPPLPGVAASAADAPGAVPDGTTPMVNLNSATQAQLEELPGVGPVTAQSILAFRSENGAFTAVDELLEVSGIGDATLAKIAPYVTL
jgi:competence protein ComEA